MKALVTGASGFIGRYIVRELLEHGYDVRVLVRNIANIEGKVEIFHGDITKLHSIFPALKGVDVVFHNAAYAMDWGRKFPYALLHSSCRISLALSINFLLLR